MPEDINQLRAELSALSGTARLHTLLRLGRALIERFWRAGPGTPAALPDLDAAIEVLTEAHGHMPAGDGLRGQVACQLGMLLTSRHSVYTEQERDRTTAIGLLEEALAAGNLPKVLRSSAGIQLGQAYLGEMFVFLKQPAGAMNLMTGQTPPGLARDIDRSVAHLRAVLDEGPPNAEMAEVAKIMLAMAESLQMTTKGPAGGFDLSGLMEAMTAMQKLQSRLVPGSGRPAVPGAGPFLDFGFIQTMMNMDPLSRPVAVVEDQVVEAEVVEPATVVPERTAPEPVRPTPPPEPTPPNGNELRRSLRDQIPSTDADEPVWASAAALLHPDATELGVDVVDELVALARMVVDLEESPVAEDWFTLAVALCLRDRLDEDGDHADRLSGAESLLTAVRTAPAGHLGVPTMLCALGAFLAEDQPFGGVLDVVAEGFADRIDTVITAGAVTDPAELATLHALRCLCRAAGPLAELGRAAVPPDYPWGAALRAASRLAG